MKTAVYIGRNTLLFNKEATITQDAEGNVLAQFNDSDLGALFVNWTGFNPSDFEELDPL